MSDTSKIQNLTVNTKLSVNVNKIATLRNARGGSVPNVMLAAERIQAYGAEGITVHPRPDERHITYRDVRALRPVVKCEFNIEGYPSKAFIALVLEVKPEQVERTESSSTQRILQPNTPNWEQTQPFRMPEPQHWPTHWGWV